MTPPLAHGVLVTGASGFVGRHLCTHLARAGFGVHAVSRRPLPELSKIGVRVFEVDDLATHRDWQDAFAAIDTVIHLAGRAHVLRESAADPTALYHHSNVEATKAVASAAVDWGVRQFIFMSTVKVFGDQPHAGPLRPSQPTVPDDDYGRSKLEAEQWLLSTAQQQGLEVVVVRPPLIYGPEVRANFLRLMSWVERGVPLPLGMLANRRSLVSVWNLNDLLVRLIEKRGAVGGIWHVSDAEDLSTTRLVEEMARNMSRSARLFPVPGILMRFALTIVGRRAEYERLFGSLQLDVADTLARLQWQPPVPAREGLARTVQWYLRQRQQSHVERA